MAIGTTIDGLNAVTSLTTNDEVPVWDKEASGEPTKKITAQNFAAAVKTLASLLGTSDVVNDLTNSDATKVASQAEAYELNVSKSKAQQIQVTIGSAVSIASHAIGVVWSDYNIRSSSLVDVYTNKALSELFGGKTIDAAVTVYGTGVGVISDTGCSNNLISLRYYNATDAAISLNTVRMVVFYH